jgi:hypothetical protein
LIVGQTKAGDFPMSAGGAQPHKAPKRDGLILRIGAADPGNLPERRVFLPLVSA